MKVTVCDVHYEKGELVKATKRLAFKGTPIRLDICSQCDKELPKKGNREIVRTYYRIHGENLTEEELKQRIEIFRISVRDKP